MSEQNQLPDLLARITKLEGLVYELVRRRITAGGGQAGDIWEINGDTVQLTDNTIAAAPNVTIEADGTIRLNGDLLINRLGPQNLEILFGGGTLGSVIGRIPVYDASGGVIGLQQGYLPVYDTIT